MAAKLFSRKGFTLKLAGLLILLVGLGSAAFIWQAQDRIDRQEKEGATDLAGAPLAPDDSRRYTHDMELNFGKTGLIMDKCLRFFEELTHGKPLAETIAVLSLCGAGGCFFFARMTGRPSSKD